MGHDAQAAGAVGYAPAVATVITDPEPITRQAAISLVTAAVRDDFDAIRFMLNTLDVDEFVPMFHTSLTLLRALARKLRSAEGLMSLDVKLAEISHDEHRGAQSFPRASFALRHAAQRLGGGTRSIPDTLRGPRPSLDGNAELRQQARPCSTTSACNSP